MFMLNDMLESQTYRYKETERALFGCYKHVKSEGERVDDLEERLVVLFRDIMDLFTERDTLRQDMERMREEVRDEALKVCIDKFGTFEFPYFVRCDEEWMKKIQASLFEVACEKLEEECRDRMWDLNETTSLLKEKAETAWGQFEEKRAERKSWVNEFHLNLIGYAVKVGRLSELESKVRATKRREIEMEMELERHFQSVDADRFLYERYLWDGVNQDDIDARMKVFNERHNDHTAERVEMYKKLSACSKELEHYQDEFVKDLSMLYERREKDVAKRLERIRRVMLSAKKKRDERNDSVIIVLSHIHGCHNKTKNKTRRHSE